MEKSIGELVREFEVDHGLPANFCNDFLEDDDWSFVIKAQALCEAALTAAIVNELGHPKIEGLISLLNIDGRAGKIEFAKKLDLIPKEFEDVMRAMRRFVTG